MNFAIYSQQKEIRCTPAVFDELAGFELPTSWIFAVQKIEQEKLVAWLQRR